MNNSTKSFFIASCLMAAMASTASAEIVKAGAGSYTTTHPGYDKANRNSYPQGTPQVSGVAATRPVPTNDWWSQKLTTAQPNNLFNYPLGLKTLPGGLDILVAPIGGSMPADASMTVGVEGVSQSTPTVSDYSDWTVTFHWENSSGSMDATAGIGMPIVYFTKTGTGAVKLTFIGTAHADGNILVVKEGYNRQQYAVYAPTGSTWSVNGATASSTLAGKNYWSVAVLPHNCTDASAKAREWAAHAFAFPRDTRATWSYNAKDGKVETTYTVTVDNKEGNGTMLMGLLPHHWANLSADAPTLTADTYNTARGEMKMMAANRFKTVLTFHGVLPTLPKVTNSKGYSADELKRLTKEVINDDGLSDWTDSYNDGQLLMRLVQTGRIAREAGMTDLYNTIVAKVKTRLENWLSYKDGEVAFLFYYHKPWSAMLGYPAGHGQDNNINDHHFHWGYLIQAAAFISQTDKTWMKQWGPMIELLIRDAASTDRNDTLFPYQRAFSPYAGHCWANGTASIGTGNDQESTSEAMQFHYSLLNWAEVTGNTQLRDLAIYMYVTEASAAEEYWFDVHQRNLPSTYTSYLVSRVFTNAFDNQNFWGGGIAGSYGIEIYPVHAGSFYLMNHPKWASGLWQAMTSETGILNNEANPNIWYDTWWKFLAMFDATKALKLYADYPGRGMKFGVSQAHTYQWLHAMNQLGHPNMNMTADSPTAMVFDKGDVRTYVAHNYGSAARKVTFSDGFSFTVDPGALVTATGDNPDYDPNAPEEPEGPDTPDNPNQPGGSCAITSDEASEGTFAGPYTVTFSTTGSAVTITAHFEGSYIGLDPCYLWNETDGFKEIQMKSENNQTWSATLNDLTAGTTLSLRIKLPFSGGLAVTKTLTYVVGTECGTPENPENPENPEDPKDPEGAIETVTENSNDIQFDAHTHILYADASTPCVLYAWTANGRTMLQRSFVGKISFDISEWPAGIYFIRLEGAGAPRVLKLAK